MGSASRHCNAEVVAELAVREIAAAAAVVAVAVVVVAAAEEGEGPVDSVVDVVEAGVGIVVAASAAEQVGYGKSVDEAIVLKVDVQEPR